MQVRKYIMYATIDNLNIYYTKEGTGDSILLLHGWGCDSSTLNVIKNNLINKHTCYSVDLCGFGKSQPPLYSFDTVNYAKIIFKLLCKLNLQHTIIIGHSFGGRVAIVMSALYPNLVTKLILIGSAGIRINKLSTYLKVRRYKLKKFLVKFKLLNENSLKNSGSTDFNAVNAQMKETFIKVVNQDLSKYAKLISCDTLLIYGRNDTATPLKIAYRLNKLIKSSALVIIENASHYCFLEKTYEVNSIIAAML